MKDTLIIGYAINTSVLTARVKPAFQFLVGLDIIFGKMHPSGCGTCIFGYPTRRERSDMACATCNGTGYYQIVDYTPDGVEFYREVCRICNPDAELGVAELVCVEYNESMKPESNFMESRQRESRNDSI